MLPDETCPECHGAPELVHTFRGGVRKRCTACGHVWREDVPIPSVEIVRGGWVRINDETGETGGASD